jgi:glutaredoxin
MAETSLGLAAPLIQETPLRNACYSGKALVLLCVVIGLIFAILPPLVGQPDLAVQRPTISLASPLQVAPSRSLAGPAVGSAFQGQISGSAGNPWISRHQIRGVQAKASENLKEASGALKAASGVVSPLLGGFYKVEAPFQARVAGAIGGINAQEVKAEIEAEVKAEPCVIYSYPLSPFCTEAVALLESTGCKFKKVEPGLEWFLLGPKGSNIRAELGEMTGQTSFPHIFIGGQSVGGLFSGGPSGSGIAGLAESGELVTMLKQAGAC